MGEWLRAHEYLPECILTSPAKRAHQTAKYLIKGAELDDSIIELDDSLYTSLADHILSVIHSCDHQYESLLVVGHDSGMEDLVLELANGPVRAQANGKIMPTASIAIFEYEGSKWHKLEIKHVALVDIIRPKEID